MAADVLFRFTFVGGLADVNQLNFYEAGRFYYGAARLLLTVEHFRQSGHVLSRLDKRVAADFRVGAPGAGSWTADIVEGAPLPAKDVRFPAPLPVMITYTLYHLAFPTEAIQLAANVAAQNARSDKGASQREILLNRFYEDHRLAVTAIEVALRREPGDAELLRARTLLITAAEQQKILRPYKELLDAVPEGARRELLEKAKDQIADVGRPLRDSATELILRTGTNGARLARLDRSLIDALQGERVARTETIFIGSLVRYDKEKGTGLFRIHETAEVLPFYVKKTDMGFMRNQVIDSMKPRLIKATFFRVTNKLGTLKRLVFKDILGEVRNPS